MLVSGHTLVSEGAPHVVSEDGRVERVQNSYGGIGGYGRGLCSCGEMSRLLASASKRKAWHREHKATVRHLQEKKKRRVPRIAGHKLLGKGIPFDDEGEPIDRGPLYSKSSGVGRARCECGAMSSAVRTVPERMRWHVGHRMRVLEARRS